VQNHDIKILTHIFDWFSGIKYVDRMDSFEGEEVHE